LIRLTRPLAGMLVGLAVCCMPSPSAQATESTSRKLNIPGYTTQKVEGWQVLVSDELADQMPEKTDQALTLLAEQLRIVKRVLPPSAVERLQPVPIWFSPPYPNFGQTGEYHPGAGWLEANGRRPELHRCVEFTNVARFQKEIERMPVLVLHELAHAFHHQVLGFDHRGIKQAYDQAVASGAYDAVKRHDGRTEKSYAMVTPMEYFAESSEAFFGKNDFYPFNRKQLKAHDPRMEALLKKLWYRLEPDGS
jgi:hypothetical protein